MKMSIKKLMSLLLSIMLVAGCMVVLPTTAGAEVSGLKTEDFSSIASAADVTTVLAASELPWTFNALNQPANGTMTYSAVDRGDENGTALKWEGKANVAGGHWQTGYWPSNVIVLNNDLADTDAEGTQVWMSIDVKMEDARFVRQMIMYDKNTTAATNMELLTKANGVSTATSGGVSVGTVVGNGWHTLEVCQEKLADSKAEVRVFFDDFLISDTTYDAVKPFYKLHIWQGNDAVDTTGSIYIDNVKTWKQAAADDDKPMYLYKITEAADWGTAPAGVTVTDVVGSSGKAANDSVIRMEAAAGGSTKSAMMTVDTDQSKRADDKYDLLIDFDLKACDLNWRRNIGVYVSPTDEAGTTVKTSAYQALAIAETGIVGDWAAATNKTNDMLTPVNQWNHFTIRLQKDSTISLYMNGIKVWTHTTEYYNPGIDKLLFWAEYKGSAATVPGFATEIDNYTVRYCPVANSEAECTAARPVYRNYDFTGIENNVTDYQVLNGAGTLYKAAPDMSYAKVSEDFGNLDAIKSGFAGKAASDKVMKFYTTKTGSNWKQISYNSTNSVWGGKTIAPGSTVRGGVSVLFDENSFETTTARDKRVVLTVSPTNTTDSTTMSQIELQFTSGGILVKNKTTGTATEISKRALLNKWYRAEYVLNIADGTGEKNTVDLYLDGKLITETPIEVDYDYPANTTQDDTDPVGKINFAVIDQGAAPVYVDDFTFEYIPVGCTGSEIARTALLADTSDKTVSINKVQGIITALDKAESEITAAQLNAKLCDSTKVSVVANDGSAVSGVAAGNYAVLSRDVWPAIFYKVEDLNVTVANGAVNAELPYDGDENTVMLVAVYNAGKAMVVCDTDTSADGKLSVSVPSEGAETYAVYLWNSTLGLKPYYEAARGSIPAV